MDLLFSGVNIILIIIGFGLLIFIHEAGHFVAAKWAGIRTHAFAIGFGPPIASWRKGVGFCWGSSEDVVSRRFGRPAVQMTDRELSEEGLGETEYSLRWLPLGGFVRMLGQDDLSPVATLPQERFLRAFSVAELVEALDGEILCSPEAVGE